MMKPFRSTLPLDEALAIVRDTVVPIARTERVTLEDAHGRVLATAITAGADVPSFDRAAMDGYAVVAADTIGASRERPVTLRIAGRVYAGDAAGTAIEPGVCLEIATGAPLPPGADAVIMVEETALADMPARIPHADATSPAPSGTTGQTAHGAVPATSQAAHGAPAAAATPAAPHTPATYGHASHVDVQIFAEVRPGQHIIRRAADMRRGDLVLEAGSTLVPSRVGAIAAMGIAEVDVFARPVVAIVPTGNEVVPPGRPLPPGHVYDVNRYTLGGLVERHGGIALQVPTLLDTEEAVLEALAPIANPPATAAPVDLLIICGGSSVGERDLVIDALRKQGEVLFHGIAVKPGKPTAFARLGSSLVLGMPGNPTSCLSNAYVLMIPLLRALARLPAAQPRVLRLTLAQRASSPRGRLQFLPVRVDGSHAVPTFKGSGEITSLSQADGYVTIPADAVIEAGTPVDVTLY